MSDSRGLVNGVIYKQILIFFFPIFLGSVFQQLYSFTDSIVVGNYVGKEALAAIDATSILSSIFINFFVGVSSGATIIVSQRFGAMDYKNVKKALTTSILMALVAGIFIMIVGRIAAFPLLKMLEVPSDLINMSIDYIKIYFLGGISLTIYNIGSGLLRALGDSKTPLYILIIGTIANIFLDLFFVVVLNQGVKGAAIATVASMTVTAVLVTLALFRKPKEYNLDFKDSKFSFYFLKLIFLIGIPIGFEASLYDISNFIIRRSVNTLGTDVIASWAVTSRIDAIIWLLLEAFSISLATFVGQNYGCGKIDRIKKGLKLTFIFSLVGVSTLSIGIMTFAEEISMIFVDDRAVADITNIIIGILGPGYILFIPSKMFGATIRGTGESFRPMLFTLIGTCALRLVWILGFVQYNPSVELLMICYPVTWFITSLMFTIYYLVYRKKKFAIVTKKAA